MRTRQSKQQVSIQSPSHPEGVVEPYWMAGVLDSGRKFTILRHSLGHLCGYVQVKPGDRAYEMVVRARKAGRCYASRYDRLGARARAAARFNPLDVHGGVTFAGFASHWAMRRHVWVGFDCAHAGDVVPAMATLLHIEPDAIYRTVEFVLGELKQLDAELVESGYAART